MCVYNNRIALVVMHLNYMNSWEKVKAVMLVNADSGECLREGIQKVEFTSGLKT